MKSDEDVRMISAEAPVLLAKACELFILDLTIRAYCYSTIGDADKLKKKTVAREDVVMGACGSGSGR
jgi:nuclear transcription factor Y, gamma